MPTRPIHRLFCWKSTTLVRKALLTAATLFVVTPIFPHPVLERNSPFQQPLIMKAQSTHCLQEAYYHPIIVAYLTAQALQHMQEAAIFPPHFLFFPPSSRPSSNLDSHFSDR